MRLLLPMLLTVTVAVTTNGAIDDPTESFEPAEIGEELESVVEYDCLATTESVEIDDEAAPTSALSDALETARRRRSEIVAIAKSKMDRLVDDARQRGGRAQGPAADWIRRQFKYEPTTSFLMHLNGVLGNGLMDAEHWIEPPKPRPACDGNKEAVAQLGGNTVWLCDPFYRRTNDVRAMTLFHEALHLHGIEDCPGLITPATPREKRLCAFKYEEMLDYLWREAP